MSKLGSFALGAALGAGIALLYAPQKGEDTRALLCEKANAVWGEAKDFAGSAGVNAQSAYQTAQARGGEVFNNVSSSATRFAQDTTSRVSDFAQGAVSRGKEIYSGAASQAQEAAQEAKPVFTDANDDLREKIEAARQRIAAQVVQNAEESKGAAPVEVEPTAQPEAEASDSEE